MTLKFRLFILYFMLNEVYYMIDGGNIPPVSTVPAVKVQKCCSEHELIQESKCVNVTLIKETPWKPVFINERGLSNIQINYKLVKGIPQCGSRQAFSIFHYRGSSDKLSLLPNGRLRHYFLQQPNDEEVVQQITDNEPDPDNPTDNQKYFDHELGSYCMDKAILPSHEKKKFGDTAIAEYAIVCNPDVPVQWYDTNFILRRIVDPACHGIALALYLAIAIIHFVMQQLRDLVGNILTTLMLSLAIGQVADTVRIFTEFTSPTTFLIADCVLYISILGAFFWLNSLGYYIWKTFRSRNVFLRITDGRKYCYYSFYVWGCTIGMAMLAVFAHFTLDMETSDRSKAPSPIAQGALGWLGIAVFFTPIAFTILINIFFYVTTAQIIDTMSAYGRIHHKLKFSFDMFIQIFLIMAVGWLCMLMSWLPHNSMYYVYIFSNALQAPLLFYVTILNQKRVRFLIRKACCYEKCIIPCFRPDEREGPEWGEEMMAMNR